MAAKVTTCDFQDGSRSFWSTESLCKMSCFYHKTHNSIENISYPAAKVFIAKTPLQSRVRQNTHLVVMCTTSQCKLLTGIHLNNLHGLGVLGLNISNQKSRKFHELPRKLFHFKPLTPTHPGGAVLGYTGSEGGRGRKVGVRELEGRKVG